MLAFVVYILLKSSPMTKHNRALATTKSTSQQLRDLQEEFAAARRELTEAEAKLAEEQAAVNAFRMHCRLRLDDMVDAVLELYTDKQTLLTRFQLLKDAHDLGIPYDDEHPFWQTVEDDHAFQAEHIEELVPYHLPKDKASEKRLYRQLVKKFHPDLINGAVGADYATSMMAAVNTAYEAGDVQTLYDLAGELDPTEVVELSLIETKEIRQLREKLLKCQRRRRKVGRQLHILRDENTAKLWRRAQELESDSKNWWDEVRRDLGQTVERLREEVAHLQVLIDEFDPEGVTTPETSEDEELDMDVESGRGPNIYGR